MIMAQISQSPTYQGGVLKRLHRFYRGTTFQAIVLGLISFTQPGIWDALNSKEKYSSKFIMRLTVIQT